MRKKIKRVVSGKVITVDREFYGRVCALAFRMQEFLFEEGLVAKYLKWCEKLPSRF